MNNKLCAKDPSEELERDIHVCIVYSISTMQMKFTKSKKVP